MISHSGESATTLTGNTVHNLDIPRTTLRRLSLKVSAASGLLPMSLVLDGVESSHQEYLGGGGFADIYSGTYKGEKVALKRLRVFLSSEESQKRKILRVRTSRCIASIKGLNVRIL